MAKTSARQGGGEGVNLVQVDLEGARPSQHEAHEELAGDLHQLSALPQSSASTCAMPTCTTRKPSRMLPFLQLCNLADERRQQGAGETECLLTELLSPAKVHMSSQHSKPGWLQGFR